MGTEVYEGGGEGCGVNAAGNTFSGKTESTSAGSLNPRVR